MDQNYNDEMLTIIDRLKDIYAKATKDIRDQYSFLFGVILNPRERESIRHDKFIYYPSKGTIVSKNGKISAKLPYIKAEIFYFILISTIKKVPCNPEVLFRAVYETPMLSKRIASIKSLSPHISQINNTLAQLKVRIVSVRGFGLVIKELT